jgi:para-aminobenzoate synthetase / 4-amino-4-deoxychorismate lyase
MKDIFLLFEDTKSSPPTAFLFREPVAEIKAENLSEIPLALEKMDEWRSKGYFVAGAAAYEAGWAFIKNKSGFKAPSIPLLQFYVFKNKETVRLEDLMVFQAPLPEHPFIYEVQENIRYEAYAEKLKKLQAYFINGETYQVNFSLRQNFKTDLNSPQLYRSLRSFQKVSYGAYLQFPQGATLSFSPELFFKKEGSKLTTKPMKGTSPRSSKLAIDEKNRNFLRTDEKTLAENLMIVDLLRNDMGRLAKPGSVEVENLFEVQSFETVHQMLTTIHAEIDPQTKIGELFECLFPCGSITGAPKVRTMEIISELEDEPRGIYTGSIGYITPENNFYFNVAIRTLVQKSEYSYELGLGGGVLVDSKPQDEYKECLLKGQFVKKINDGFTIFESFLFDGKECVNLDMHLDRQEKSCHHFGFPFDRFEAQERLRMFLRGAPNKPVKIKLSVTVTGALQLDAASVGLPSEKPLIVAISEQRTNSKDLFLYHKTSHRHLYDNEGRIAARNDIYDILFFNEREELTEASRHNVFLQIEGQWFTPVLSSGVLPGVQREKTIKELNANEKSLSKFDLQRAERILLTNSVRGHVEVKLKGQL